MLDYNYAIRRNLKFIDIAYLSLSRVSKEQNVPTFIAVMDADMLVVVEEIGTSGELRINSPVGKRLPLYGTACGKVLLAGLSEEDRKAYYKRISLQPFSSAGTLDTDKLEKELALIKAEGMAYHKGEYGQGVWVAAAPIHNGSEKVIAAVALIVPVSYLGFDSILKYTNAIKGCAGEISQVISRIS